MKLTVLTALLLSVFALVLPLLNGLSSPMTAPIEDTSDDPGLYFTAEALSDSAPVRVLVDGETVTMTMAEYLTGALSAEMPASFHPEALKAQSVALRTYLLHKMQVAPTHEDADICTDHTCCAAWCSEEVSRERWGDDYDLYSAKMAAAVRETDGLYLSYDSEPILAVFHSSSAGATEVCASVWGGDYPYLVSVESPETASDVPNYVSEVTMTAEEFTETVRSRFPEAEFSGAAAEWLEDVSLTESGRLASIKLGGVTVTGTQLRSLFGLRSTAVSIYTDGDSVTLTTTGYGHGVGMSQYGANVMAKNGSTYRDILENYYPGTEMVG